jgi:hypothetical protein
MTSSRKSRFNFAKRRLLFLSAQKAAVYHWQNGSPGSSYLFDINEEGRINFERYLRETPNHTMYIMVDLFDEEFRRDVIPHVFGRDRTSILERKKARLFRDTQYQYTRVQGREESGRRDDRILMSALTNPAIIEQWTALLDKYKVPLAGISSLPLFTETILGEIPEPSDYMLVVSMQSISGLRQTFFQNRELRISRLVPLPRYGTVPYAPYLEEEIEKIRRYLSSLRLVSMDEPLDIHFFLTGSLLEELRDYYQNTNTIHYHFLDINEMAARAGFPLHLHTPFCDQYFACQFLKKSQPNYYASPTSMRYSTLQRLRISMLAASLLLMATGFVWSGLNFKDGLMQKQNSIAAENKTQFYQSRYDIARGRLPKTPVEPGDLKVAVDIAATMNKYKSSPVEMMQALSRGLNQFPDIRLDNFEWQASLNPATGPAVAAAPPAIPAPAVNPETGQPEVKYRYYQVATVNAHLEPFDGNFRKAMDRIDKFVDVIRGGAAVYSVNVLSMPLDISSTANLSGNTGAFEGEAKLSLNVVVGVGDES